MLPCGRSPSGPCPSGPIRRVGSSCTRSLVLRSEYCVQDRGGVLDIEPVSQSRLDFLSAAARDRHLGRQQACPGGRAPLPRAGTLPRRPLDRGDRGQMRGPRGPLGLLPTGPLVRSFCPKSPPRPLPPASTTPP